MTMDFTVGRIETARELRAIRPAWEALFERSIRATPFQSPAWLLPWWRHFGEGELLAFAAWQGERLLGLLPCYVYSDQGTRKLLLLGSGTSDHCDGLFDPSGEHELAGALLEEIARARDRFDLVDLQPLGTGSPLLEVPAPAGLVDTRSMQEPCPLLRLPGSRDELDPVLPPGMRQNLRYYRRRAERAGRLRFERATDASLPVLLQAWVELHGARWSERGGPGVLADERVRAFHADAAPELLGAGLLRLYALRLDERIIAALYGFAGKGRFYYYLGGFDPEFRALSPGTLMIGHAIEAAVREGLAEFDFLRGAEPYKYHWGAQDRPMAARRLVA